MVTSIMVAMYDAPQALEAEEIEEEYEEDEIIEPPIDDEDNETEEMIYSWRNPDSYDIDNHFIHSWALSRLYKLDARPCLFKGLRMRFWENLFNRAVIWKTEE